MKTISPSPRQMTVSSTSRAWLCWRRAWWAWPPLVWSGAMLASPTIWAIGAMLHLDDRCDHPLFWWGLPMGVALANAAAIAHLSRRHARRACPTRRAAGLAYYHAAWPVSLLACLGLGWATGFWNDMAPLAIDALGMQGGPWHATLGSVAAALLFAGLSHVPAALALPWLAFARQEGERRF